ncbi:MAG: hypothetical protein PHH82_00385 [Candidatus ainarchaeum sp.]|nr:hypothetical protein [Candidatus ainarchaeum sp.]
MKKVHSSKFVEIECKCGSKQYTFNKPASKISCNKCEEVLATPGASHPKLTKGAKIVKKEEKKKEEKKE